MAVTLNSEPQGWVISFRSKDDINTLSLQLSQVQQYADNLRAVQHEHRNLISTIAGLLFLKRYDNALDLIQQQSESHQKVLDFIARNFKVNHLAEGGEAIVEIADQGCGIDESLRDRIFERGVTSSDSGDHGIGLWLVRSYVEQAGGNIVVDDNIPFGTIFTLYIPLTRDEHHG